MEKKNFTLAADSILEAFSDEKITTFITVYRNMPNEITSRMEETTRNDIEKMCLLVSEGKINDARRIMIGMFIDGRMFLHKN